VTSDSSNTPRMRDHVMLWFAFLGPPVAWIVHIGARYPLVPTACSHDFPLLLHFVTIATLAATVGSGIAAGVLYRRSQRAASTKERAVVRLRYMAVGGLLLSVLFSTVILAELVPALMQDPCLDVRL
jgi:hypothetical protein